MLSDEEPCARALELKQDLAEGVTAVAVPKLLEYEMASVLATAVRRGRISATDAVDGIQTVFDMGLITCDERESVIGAITLAIQTHGSIYDCAYLSTAMSLDCELFTADRRFINSAGRVYGRIRHISEYSP